MHAVRPRSYNFGRFVLDLDRHRLMHDGALVELPSRALFVLQVLVEQAGHTLSKDEITQLAWPDAQASDANLMVQISKLRRVLRDGGDTEGWIRTVRGKGYRLEVDVRAGEGVEAGVPPAAIDSFDRELHAGIVALQHFDPAGARLATEHLDRCLTLRPEDGRALAYRALAWIHQWYLGLVGGRQVADRAPHLAQQAQARAPELAMAHVARGAIAYGLERDFATSDQCLRRALAIEPECSAAQEYLAYSMLARARFEEGRHHLRLAQRRDPSNVGLNAHLGTAFYLERRYDRARASFEAALTLYPDHLVAHVFGALSAAFAGRPIEAMRSCRRLVTRNGDVPLAHAVCGTVSALTGDYKQARESLRWLREARLVAAAPSLLAAVEVALGEHDAAMRNLQASIEAPSPGLCMLAVDPIWDPLRERDDFRRLLTAVNLHGIA